MPVVVGDPVGVVVAANVVGGGVGGVVAAHVVSGGGVRSKDLSQFLLLSQILK